MELPIMFQCNINLVCNRNQVYVSQTKECIITAWLLFIPSILWLLTGINICCLVNVALTFILVFTFIQAVLFYL